MEKLRNTDATAQLRYRASVSSHNFAVGIMKTLAFDLRNHVWNTRKDRIISATYGVKVDSNRFTQAKVGALYFPLVTNFLCERVDVIRLYLSRLSKMAYI